jgi:signal transduction histidine kinase
MFNRMQDAAKRMQTLIQDLLVYSRTGTQERKFETTNLNEIITDVKEDLMEELKEKHATIEAHQLSDADIIPFQFRQLMHNLIGNSLKFSNPVIPPHIIIKSEIAKGIKFNNENLSPQNKYCHITVSDNGIGFEQQYNEKIFEVFQRLYGQNEYNGTGIGLSIVKKIVENHNGIITAYGELNKGATFEVFIPAT